MNPEVKEKWISVLRSGHYEQGQASLNDDGVDFETLAYYIEKQL